MGQIIRTAFIALASLAFMAPSMYANLVHQLAHASPDMAASNAGVSVLTVALAGIAAICARRKAADRSWFLAGVCVVAFICCTSYNITCAIGVSSATRAERAEAITKASGAVASLQRQLDEKLGDRAPLKAKAEGKTAAVLEYDLAEMRANARWTSTKGCTIPTEPESRQLCADYAAKNGAREAAVKAEALDTEIAALRARLDAANASPNAAPGRPADSQVADVAAILEATGYAVASDKVATSLNLQYALILEVLASLGPLILFETFGARETPSAPRIEPRNEARIEPLPTVSIEPSETASEPLSETAIEPNEPPSEPRKKRKKSSYDKMLDTDSLRVSKPPKLTVLVNPTWGERGVSNEFIAEAVRLYETHQSIRVVAEEMGVDRNKVQRALNKARSVVSNLDAATYPQPQIGA